MGFWCEPASIYHIACLQAYKNQLRMLRITLAACGIALGSAVQATVPYTGPYPYWWNGEGCERPHWCLNATQDWRIKCDWDECKTCVKYCGEKNYSE